MPESTPGVLVFPDVEELDFVGPWELFGLWRKLADGPRCLLIGPGPGPVRARHGLRVTRGVSVREAEYFPANVATERKRDTGG